VCSSDLSPLGLKETIVGRWLLGLLLSSLASLSAFANDTAAELATCGLVFVKNPDVEMRSEESLHPDRGDQGSLPALQPARRET
jgi:hypothetical protein